MTVYTWLWIGWLVYFAVVEGYALYVSRRDGSPAAGTLSHHVWAWFGTAPGVRADAWAWTRRAVLGLFLLWLCVHFLAGGRIV